MVNCIPHHLHDIILTCLPKYNSYDLKLILSCILQKSIISADHIITTEIISHILMRNGILNILARENKLTMKEIINNLIEYVSSISQKESSIQMEIISNLELVYLLHNIEEANNKLEKYPENIEERGKLEWLLQKIKGINIGEIVSKMIEIVEEIEVNLNSKDEIEKVVSLTDIKSIFDIMHNYLDSGNEEGTSNTKLLYNCSILNISYELSELEDNYSKLYLSNLQIPSISCPSSNIFSKHKCLLCANILCTAPCCNITLNNLKLGALYIHAINCNYGNGVFLSFHKGNTIAISLQSANTLHSPFYNAFRESIYQYLGGNKGRISGNAMAKYILDGKKYLELRDIMLFGRLRQTIHYVTLRTHKYYGNPQLL